MNDNKISNNAVIEAALKLDGTPQKVQAFYEQWAENYNIDTRSVEYSGPDICAALLIQHQKELDQLDFNARLLDAGCGTGFVGEALKAKGYSNVYGFDLSDSMAKQALETDAYADVNGGIDMMKAADSYAAASFDAVLSVGVFTLGHVPPQALEVLLQLTSPGGLLVMSTRSHYYDQTDFQALVDRLIEAGEAELLQLIKDAPYNNDGSGHYWVFRKLN